MKKHIFLLIAIVVCLSAFAPNTPGQISSPAKPKPTPTPVPVKDDYFNLSLDDVNKFRAAE